MPLNLKKYIILSLTSSFSFLMQAQEKPNAFTLPQNAKPTNYSSNSVLVKVKQTKEDIFKSSSFGRTKSIHPLITGISPLVKPSSARAGASRMGPRVQTHAINISLYYRIQISETDDIETVINSLYASGHFELVEPEYIDSYDIVPSDPLTANQYYLALTKAYEAWDITQGSEDMIIGIVDSGGDLDHPDLSASLYVNQAELNGTPGVDDDDNGYLDDINGWDFVGADTLNGVNTAFIGDNNPQVFVGGIQSHGTWVAGCAAASTNNAVGIAGMSFKSKIIFTKHSGDNQKPSRGSVYKGYDGIIYAAENGAKIINCSWGGTFRSQIAQDIITYVTLDRGCLVIAAAGNDNSEANHYPSSYDYVLSVAATDGVDRRASFSNFGSTVDISAPGVAIFSTQYDNTYGSVQGTSFSSPIVAGAAALVWAHNPSYTPLQVAEQLRISADPSMYQINPTFVGKLGKGRLDVLRALTLEFPSLRASKPKLLNAEGSIAEPGQQAFLSFDITNFLKASSSGLEITLSTTSGWVTIQKNKITPGIIPQGVTINTALTPFELTLNAAVTENTEITMQLSFTDGIYTDQQAFQFILNPTYVDIDENNVATTLSATGRIGYQDPQNQDKGIGFIFNDESILYEMGLMMGTSSANIINNVRGVGGSFDQDFFVGTKIKKSTPGAQSFSEVSGVLATTDKPSTAPLVISYKSMVWQEQPFDKFIIVEYTVKNNTADPVNDFYFGMFADWDISANGAQDAAGWDGPRKVGYVYPQGSNTLPLAGIQLLTGNPHYYAIDNDQNVAGNPFGIYDNYTDTEKFTSLSTDRLVAGTVTPAGNDVSHVVSRGPFSFAANEEIVIAFALHAGDNLTDLLASADAANELYNLTLQAPQPVVPVLEVCYGAPATIMATGASSFNWYKGFTGGSSFHSGTQFTTNNLFNDTTFYVSNADNSYESLRTRANVIVKANPTILASGAPTFCEGQSILLSVAPADEYLWSSGGTTQTIEVSDPGLYSVTVKDNSLTCESTSNSINVVVNTSPVASFSSLSEAVSGTPVIFTDGSSNASEWFWQFGDGQTSTQQNPTHQYADGGDYQITLTVISGNGCQHSITQGIDVITSTEKELASAISIYPNPINESLVIKADGLPSPYFDIQLMSVQGQLVYKGQQEAINSKMLHSISTVTLPPGMYFVKIRNEGKTVIRKIVKTE